MKTIRRFSLMLLSVCAFAACGTDLEKVTVSATVDAPALYPYEQAIVVREDNMETTTTFEWSPADFGYSASVNYSLMMQVGDGEQQLVGVTFADSIEVKLKDFNTTAISAGAPVNEETPVSLFLIASISDSYDKPVSAPITVRVTPLSAVPAPLHLIGNVLGNIVWDNANYEYVMFRDNNLAVNTYTANFKSGEFKFIAEENLGTWDGLYRGSGGVLDNHPGDNINDISANGYYTVTADLKTLTYTVTPYDASAAPTYTNISLIGEFNDWNGDLDLTQTDYDPHIWIADDVVLPVGKLKFRVNHDWGTSWGGGEAFPYGTGNGDDLKVPEAGTYFVKFNDLTKHYVFYKKE